MSAARYRWHLRSKPPQLLSIHRSFDRISVMMIDSTCFTHRCLPHPRMIHFHTETRPLRARYSNDEDEKERQCQSRDTGHLTGFSTPQENMVCFQGSVLPSQTCSRRLGLPNRELKPLLFCDYWWYRVFQAPIFAVGMCSHNSLLLFL
jgi:hypothetical protein